MKLVSGMSFTRRKQDGSLSRETITTHLRNAFYLIIESKRITQVMRLYSLTFVTLKVPLRTNCLFITTAGNQVSLKCIAPGRNYYFTLFQDWISCSHELYYSFYYYFCLQRISLHRP
jgi:hypothetical protein